MISRRLAVVAIAAATVLAACGGGTTTPAPATAGPTAGATVVPATQLPTAAAGQCSVGVSWATFQEERYRVRDEPALQAAVAAGDGLYIANDAKNSAETQATNVETLIALGIDVLVINSVDSAAALESVAAAQAAGIPVIAYDRLIDDASVLYLTHDNLEVGRTIAREVMKVAPEGTYAIIKGDEANPNSAFLYGGFLEIIQPAIDSGAITIGGDLFTKDWVPDNAQTNMEQILTANDNNIDAVLSQNDGMAGGVIAALTAQGLAGDVPVGGQDGDVAALNRVALGTQTVSVLKDSAELGTAAGTAAIQLCENPDPSTVSGTAPFTSPDGNTISSLILAPLPITKDNLQKVLDINWTTAERPVQGRAGRLRRALLIRFRPDLRPALAMHPATQGAPVPSAPLQVGP